MENDTPEWKRAEQRVAQTLSKLLLEDYLVLNDVPYKYGNLDHVVIRPDRTVFLVETKAHRGVVTTDGRRLLVNGRPLVRNPLAQVNRAIRWLRQTSTPLFDFNPWIVAVVVFPNATVRVRRPVKRVNVVGLDRLVEFLQKY